MMLGSGFGLGRGHFRNELVHLCLQTARVLSSLLELRREYSAFLADLSMQCARRRLGLSLAFPQRGVLLGETSDKLFGLGSTAIRELQLAELGRRLLRRAAAKARQGTPKRGVIS